MGSETETVDANIDVLKPEEKGENDEPTLAQEKPTKNGATTENAAKDRAVVTKVLGRSKLENARPRAAPEVARRAKATRCAKLLDVLPVYDIDSKHDRHPLFGSDVAVELYAFLRELEKERLDGSGDVLKLATPRPKFRMERVSMINFFFERIRIFRTQSNTIHTAIYYVDRFVQKREAPIKNFWVVVACALYLASKYEDIYPVGLNEICAEIRPHRKGVSEPDILEMESEFLDILGDFMGINTTSFAHRYLQAVDMELNEAAVCTARYLCALAVSHYPLTGHYYSLLAAAAVFISYNKYSESNASGDSVIEYPEAFKYHAGYTLEELAPVVTELVELAEKMDDVERVLHRTRTNYAVAIYDYYQRQAGVVTATFPDFKTYFKELSEPAKENAAPPSDA